MKIKLAAALKLLVVMLLGTTLLPLARAAELSIALGADVTSMDPHFHNLTPNNNVAEHIFETLVGKDARSRLKPGLAESWRAIDDLTWEFKLRKEIGRAHV